LQSRTPGKNTSNNSNSNKSKYGGSKKKSKSTKKKAMLNISKLDYFKWDVNEILNGLELSSEEKNIIKATLIAKASKISINTAKDYIIKKREESVFDREIAEKLIKVMNKYKKWR